jgi:alpha-tubulin suppressor-like RCC1 family protein
VGALAVLAAVAIILPAAAPAGQSSQATPAAVAQITTGVYHSCAVLGLADARVRCWGFSGDGQAGYGNTNAIGDDETAGSVGPVDLGAGRTVKALAAGDYHSCAVLDDGSVRCWGFAFEGQLGYGSRNQIGDNETPASAGPVDLGAGRTATAITAGNRHTCALLNGGDVRCWGLGEVGQLGYGSTVTIGDTAGETPGSVGPVNLGPGRTATAITAGGGHTCAILDDGSVRCWGYNTNGELGYGNTSAVLDPSAVGPVNLGAGRTAKAISAGDSHTCAVLDDGSVRCWGLGDVGQLGYGNTATIGDNETPGSVGPVDLGPGRKATAISAGGNQLASEGHTCAVLDDGTVRCWGSGVFGQLGYGNVRSVGDNESPGSVGTVDLGPGRTATAISAGAEHTCARLDDNSVRCWGNGADGRLGHCDTVTVGDDETPGSIAPVDLGAGGAACGPSVSRPPAPATSSGGAAGARPSPLPAAPVTPSSDDLAALRVEKVRAQGLRDCRAAVSSEARSARSRARRRYRPDSGARALALRRVARRAAREQARCLRRFGRTPGRVTTLAAQASSSGKIILTFRAPGSDGSSPPAARSYVIKQSPRPIRTRRDFERSHALCKGRCTFAVTKLQAAITLDVTQLRRNTTYYYSVAALDNVSERMGPQSKTVLAKTR